MYSWTEGNAGTTRRRRRYGARRSKLRALLHLWQSFETFDRIVDRRPVKLCVPVHNSRTCDMSCAGVKVPKSKCLQVSGTRVEALEGSLSRLYTVL